jgi:hypothetical protein
MARRLTNLRIDEISSVDKAANAGARIVLMKRDGGADLETEQDSPGDTPDWNETLAKLAKLVRDIEPSPLEKMRKRVAQMCAAEPGITTDAAVLRIASSRGPDAEIWSAYRKAADARTIAPPQFSPERPKPSPDGKPRVARPAKMTPGLETLYGIADDFKAQTPSMSDGAAIERAMKTSAGAAAWSPPAATVRTPMNLQRTNQSHWLMDQTCFSCCDGTDATTASILKKHVGSRIYSASSRRSFYGLPSTCRSTIYRGVCASQTIR